MDEPDTPAHGESDTVSGRDRSRDSEQGGQLTLEVTVVVVAPTEQYDEKWCTTSPGLVRSVELALIRPTDATTRTLALEVTAAGSARSKQVSCDRMMTIRAPPASLAFRHR